MLTARNTRHLVLALTAAVLLAPLTAHAGSPLGIGTAEPSFNTSGFGGPFLMWVNMEQQRFYRALTQALIAMRDDPWKLSTLISLSFLYGVFHAAGPGHGKAVISSYMIANEIQLRRGITIAIISSFLQGITALLVVGAAYVILRSTSITLTNATDFLEQASYILVAGFGFWMLLRKLRSLFAKSGSNPLGATPAPALAGMPAGAHIHSDDDYDAACACDHSSVQRLAPAKSGSRTGQMKGFLGSGKTQKQAVADFCEECGHAHMPSPQSLGGERFSLKEAFSAVVAVGLRPCSGAIIVVTFSLLNGLYLGGILSVFAMSIGTAITVSLLAITAVSAKGLAVKLAGNGTVAEKLGTTIEIAGAFFVMALGIILFLATRQFVH
ncbi:nickel/cobalt transporter [Rhizobium sp. C4]|uniref:nickel/cobalt transporter n=1 Tax=Rhizobium sp. C4 TaxID=1349800 RepID=UPI001E327685|nr:nickel/cobalt transporter [Rhizobium sp. C4]MCD2173988.1 nickel/cobalt transporter [Rhizobium sp. C4]